MIIYFANRQMQILGKASTSLPEGYLIFDDEKGGSVANGVDTLSVRIGYSSNDREGLEKMAVAGNFMLRMDKGEKEFYQILESEFDTDTHEVYLYAEDAGLDLLNTVAPAYKPASAMTAGQYIDMFLPEGWSIGVNEMTTEAKKLDEWESDANVIERIQSIANSFGECEISFSYDIDGFNLVKRCINIYKRRGEQTAFQQYRLGYEVQSIITRKSITDVATAFNCTGKKVGGKLLTLEGYTPEDPDFYVQGKLLVCRSAAEKWAGELDTDGIIVKQYSYETDKKSELCNRAITELKKVIDVKEEYTVKFKGAQPFHLGDRIHIIDTEGNLFLEARVLEYKASTTYQETEAVLGEFIHKSSGINQTVLDLSERLQNIVNDGLGQDATTLTITSSKGNIFKHEDTTTLSATVYAGMTSITTQAELEAVFGDTAVIKWYLDSDLVGTGFSHIVSVVNAPKNYSAVLEVD